MASGLSAHADRPRHASQMNQFVRALASRVGRPGAWLRERMNLSLCEAGSGTRFFLAGKVENPRADRSSIRIGSGCHIYGRLLVFARSGQIDIGDHCFIGAGAELWSAAGVRVGHRVFIAHGANVHDTDSHPLSARLRHIQFARPNDPAIAEVFASIQSDSVTIEDDAWVGFNACVLKGVTIGRGAVVAAGSVVTKDVAPYTVVAGNPAQPVGKAYP